jgi:hypothetical protein
MPALSGCATLQANLAGSTTAQVTTLAEAEQAATLVTEAADGWAVVTYMSAAQLTQIQALSSAVHAALDNLEAANAAGQSLVFASFNSALAAFNSYEAATVSPTATASAASGN